MSVTDFHEIYEPRRGGGIGSDATRTWVRIFRAVTNDPHDDAVVVTGYSGCPRFYTPYVTSNSADIGARCTDIRAEQDPECDGCVWFVTCTYTTQQGESGSPLDASTQFSFGTENFTRPLQKDAVTGEPVDNSANVPFDPAVEVDAAHQIFTLTKPFAMVDPVAIAAFTNKVNSGPFWGYPTGTVKCQGTRGEPQYDQDVGEYYILSSDFCYKEDGWKVSPMNVGFHELVAAKLQRIVDDDNQPVSEPMPLDAAGKSLTDTARAAGSFTYAGPFNAYKTTDFSAMGY